MHNIIIFLGGLLSVGAFAHDIVPVTREVRQTLKSRPVLRVGLSAAPEMGHPSATATLVRRLRELGYTGEIEVIYQTTRSNADIAFRLAQVFPEYDPVRGIAQHNRDAGISFYTEEYFQHHADGFAAIELGLMAADDFKLPPSFLHARQMLVLQPMGWGHAAQLRTLTPRGVDARDLDALKNIPFSFAVPNAATVAAGLEADPTHQTAGLLAIIAHFGRIDLAPFYGHGLRRGPTQLANYLNAIAIAQKSQPREFDKPVIVPVMIPEVRYFASALMTEFARTRVSFVDVTDRDFTTKLAAARPGEILVVMAGHVPRPMFELLFYKATLAPVTGGLNSMNLMAQFGTPYLTSNPDEVHHQHYIAPALTNDFQYLRIEEFAHALRANPVHSPLAAHTVAAFLMEARRPESALARYFKVHRSRFGPDDDRVVRGLLEVVRSRRTEACDFELTHVTEL